MGIELPTPPPPLFSFVPCRKVGRLVYTSGHGPLRADGTWISGRLGESIEVKAAQDAARLTAINLLATLKAFIGAGAVKQDPRVRPGAGPSPTSSGGCS